MTPEEQILEELTDFQQDVVDAKNLDNAKILDNYFELYVERPKRRLKQILSIKVPKKVKCPVCKDGWVTSKTHVSPDGVSNTHHLCRKCKGTGSITQEFTIKELIQGDYLK